METVNFVYLAAFGFIMVILRLIFFIIEKHLQKNMHYKIVLKNLGNNVKDLTVKKELGALFFEKACAINNGMNPCEGFDVDKINIEENIKNYCMTNASFFTESRDYL